MKLLIPSLLVSALMLQACAGNLEEGGPPAPTNCAEVIFTRSCPANATVAKCVTCSGISGCHGKEAPSIPGLDLTVEGLAASQGGKKFINMPADDVAGLCGAAAAPTPIRGKVIVDPVNPENSLLYQKVTTNFMECGSRMPFTALKPLTDADQKCILDWIKNIPGVKAGSVDAGGGGG
jgi:hypothetical protein